MLRLRTQSFRRYRISGEMPSPFSEAFLQRVVDRRFHPLSEADERTYGWTSVDNLLVTEFHSGMYMKGDWAALAVRTDKRRVNPRLLRAHLELEMEAHRKGSLDAGGSGRISREERKAIKDGLTARLLAETSPTHEHVPVLIHTKKRVAHVLALGRGANETARLLFLDTFGAELVPLTPWRRSTELLAGSALAAGLGDVQRTDFAGTASSSRRDARPDTAPGASRLPAAESVTPAAVTQEGDLA